MKKPLTFLSLAVSAGLIGYFGSVYYVNTQDALLAEEKFSAVNFAGMSEVNQTAYKLLVEKGCEYCHTQDSEQPFYFELPIAKQLMQHDINRGLMHFQIAPVLEAMNNGKTVSDVELAKIERVIRDDTMPPALYLTMHWRSNLSDAERESLLTWVSDMRAQKHANTTATAEHKDQPMQPIYTQFVVDKQKAALGELLYHDTRLSADNSISCASCHELTRGGVDGLTTSTGVGAAKGPINAPTVFNAAFHSHQFWDGRAADLQEQAGGPPLNPIEMASTSWLQIIDKLSSDPKITAVFKRTYPDGWTKHNITDAIAEFEKTLVTPNSRFDQYLAGDNAALTEQEIEGYQLVKQYKCDTCHAGQALGGQSFEVMGLKEDYFADRGDVQEVDRGRYNVTQNPYDLYRFKVPSLRNVALTAPYFHDGNATTLQQAVEQMGYYQVGVKLTPSEINAITAFLEAQTGTLNGKSLAVN